MPGFDSPYKAKFVRIRRNLTLLAGAGMAKKPEIRFTVSSRHYEYLNWLMKNTVLGRTENEVAQHVLTQRLSEMRKEDYQDEKSKGTD